MRAMRQWLKGESGQSVILIVLSIVVLCGFAALAVDIGVQSVDKGELQNAADAAALAGARELTNVATAKTTATHYAGLNGVPAANVTATTPYNGNANRIEVVCTRTVQYSFARVFGIKSKVISARAVAEKAGLSGGPFGYALFSGGTTNALALQLYTGNLYINGSVHSNNAIVMNSASQYITGNAEAVTSFTTSSAIRIDGICQAAYIDINKWVGATIPNQVVTAASIITMPDFSAEAQAEAAASGITYNGNQTFSNNSVNVDSSIYVNGTLTVSGTSFNGKGIMLATNDINISGNTLVSSSSSVCVYSKTGNISINGSNIEVNGVLYAPNGTINIAGSNITIKGRVIAKSVSINGSSISIVAGTNDLSCLPGGTVSLVE